jgi:electron transfer flavoprotein alpha subunit
MALDQGVVDSVVNSNFKILAEQIATNVAGHQQRLQILAEKSLASSLQSMDQANISVSQGMGMGAAQNGGLAQQIASLAAAVSSIQGYIKSGQTVPPVTAKAA